MYLLSWRLSWNFVSENSQVQNRLFSVFPFKNKSYKNTGCIHREVYTYLIIKLTKNIEETILLWFLLGMETDNVR